MHIVTGGAGFIGSAYIAKLNEEGIDNIIIVDSLDESDKWKNLRKLRFEDYIDKDDFLQIIRDGKLRDVKSIMHMGASSSTDVRDAGFLMENNYRYTKELCEFALENNVRFIYASSAATYGGGEKGFSDSDDVSDTLIPMNAYGYSKQAVDLWVLKNKLEEQAVGLKFFNVYGPNEYHKAGQRSVVHTNFIQVKNTGKAKLFKSHRDDCGNGQQKRDFVYVKDCVEVMYWFFENPGINGIFNCGTGKARTFEDLANSVFAALGKKPDIEYIDMPENLREHYQYFTEADMSKLKAAGCPVKLHSLEDGIKDYVQNYLEQEDSYLG